MAESARSAGEAGRTVDAAPLASRPDVELEKSWHFIPAGVWHQGFMGAENRVVLSIQTVVARDLIEERPRQRPASFQCMQ